MKYTGLIDGRQTDMNNLVDVSKLLNERLDINPIDEWESLGLRGNITALQKRVGELEDESNG